jgi:carbamoyl-phosphate synthase large subunit
VPILGTSPDAIDLAEDRDRFKQLLDKLKLRQPQSGIAKSPERRARSPMRSATPIVIRPSYVLGGRAMEIVHDCAQLDRYIARLAGDLDRPSEFMVSDKRPLLIDRYLSDAIEVDVDCLADGKDTRIVGIMEHIEEAGIHSGDSACSLPPYSLDAATIAELERQTRELALALNVGGLMNVQYAIKSGDIYVLEVNPRASRTVPFVAKVIGVPVAKIAARVMAGEPLKSFGLEQPRFEHIGVKEAVFPFARFPGVDTVLGPEMKSTGEVMGIDHSFAVAFAKSQIGGGSGLPREGTVFVSVRDADKPRILEAMRLLSSLGFQVIATGGTQRYLVAEGIKAEKVNKVAEGRPHIVDAIRNGGVQLVLIPPRAPSRWRTAGPCAELPSCIKSPTTPLFPGPSPPRRESRLISGATSRCARYRAISAAGADTGTPEASHRTVRLDRVPKIALPNRGSGGDRNFVLGGRILEA